MKLLFIIASCILLTSLSEAQDWEWIGGPSGTRAFTDIAAAPDGTLFLIGDGLRRSTDHGKTWRLIHEIEGTIYLDSNNTVYIVRSNFNTLANDVLVSTTNGDSWTQSQVKKGRHTVSSGGVIAVADRDSLYVSSNQGQTWNHTILPYSHSEYPTILFDKSGALYVAYNNDSLWRSDNYGDTWVLTSLLTGKQLTLSSQPDVLFAAAGNLVYRSSDAGVTWTSVHESSSSIRFMHAVAPDTIVLMNNGQKIDRSTDGGLTWDRVDSQLASSSIPNGFVADRGHMFVLYNHAFITRTTTTETWSMIEVSTANVSHVATTHDNSLFALASTELWTYTSSNEWQKINSAGQALRDLDVDSSGRLFIADGTLRFSIDHGELWTVVEGAGADRVAFSNSHAYLMNKLEKFRTQDFVNFTQIHDDSTYVYPIATAEPSFLYGTSMAPTFLRSSDYGSTWEEVNFPFILGSGQVSAIESVNDQVIVSVQGTGVYFSADYGITWENHSAGLEAFTTISDLLLTPDGTVFACANTGLYQFNRLSKTWTNSRTELLTPRRSSCLALGRDGRVFVGTSGDGVYRSIKSYGTWGPPTRSVSVLPTSAEITLVPNPASNEVALIGSNESVTRIEIYNTLGQCMKTIDSGDTPEIGRFSIATLPNGSYLVRLTVGTTIRSQILLIAR